MMHDPAFWKTVAFAVVCILIGMVLHDTIMRYKDE